MCTFHMYVCVCAICIYAFSTHRSQKNISGSLGWTGLIDDCEPPWWVLAGNQIQILWKNIQCLNH